MIKHEKMNGEVFAAIMAGTYVEKEEKAEASEQAEDSSDSAGDNAGSDDE